MSKQRELRREETSSDRWLIAIDLDGTTINEHGQASIAVQREIKKVEHEGHHLLVTTGRSPATTIPVIEHLGTFPEYVVCSNGAVILKRDAAVDHGYRRIRATGFEAAAVLEAIRGHFPDAHFAVEDANGQYRFTHRFPSATTVPEEDQIVVPFTSLLNGEAVRVVAIAPERDVLAFRAAVQRMDLTGVTYSLGWTAWLDIAADGITKAAAAEEIRELLGFSRDRVIAIGDGYNDIELLEWAGAEGRGIAMGHAPDALRAVATEITGTLDEDGLAQVLSKL
jgi:Cof subfamily protein (haloacid dehalogenase superfamily)